MAGQQARDPEQAADPEQPADPEQAGETGPRRRLRWRRRHWLWAAGAAAACGAVIAGLVVGLSPSRPGADGPDPGARPTAPAAAPTPTAGNLLVVQMRAGDCLTGTNMALNTSDPWPKLTMAVPCSQPHIAEVFFADSNFWPKNGPYPGDSTISKDGNAACNSAFQSYVGIAYAKSMYTWANIIPDASTWPAGDRALHCIAYYAPPGQPAGATITGSIRGTRK